MSKLVGRSGGFGRGRLGLAAAAALATLTLAGPASAADLSGDAQAPPISPPVKGASELSDGALRQAVASGEAPAGATETATGEIVVEVLFRDGTAAATRSAIREVGGEPEATVPGELVEAAVPLDELEALEADPAVRFVRLPLDYSEPVGVEQRALDPSTMGPLLGEQVVKTNADAWHAAGINGAGVKVGIIDGFDQAAYNAALAAGEIPANSGTFCRQLGGGCNVFNGGTAHGIGVAEVVADMAPGAQQYYASAISAADTQAAMQYFAAQGVDIVTRSQTGRFDGPGNGTGPIANVIQNEAVAQGMFYLNAAGNNGGRNGRLGSYYRGQFTDGDNDGWHEFASGDELLGYNCSYQNGLRWNDFGEGAQTTDYDLFLYRINGGVLEEAQRSDNAQGGGGSAPPIELAGNCDTNVAYVAVTRYATNGGDTNDTLEFAVNGAGVEHFQNPFSAAGPMADLNSPGAVAIGAIDPPNGVAIADYSSEGPTNDNRIKPDLSAAACVKSISYAPDCFNGTSSATPVAAGAAALALDGGVANSPASLKTYLLNATVDRGAAGSDNVFGRGELVLPNPPGGPDTTPPDTVIDSGPANGAVIATNSASFGFHGNPGSDTAKLQCKLDGGAFADCTSPKTFGGLANGSHTVSFRAVDAAGNADPSPAMRTFTVNVSPGDTTPPTATALDSKGKSGKTAKLLYRVGDNSGQTRETIVIKKGGRTLTTLRTNLAPSDGSTYSITWDVPKGVKGAHVFCVTAFDPSGNRSPQSCADLAIKKKRKR